MTHFPISVTDPVLSLFPATFPLRRRISDFLSGSLPTYHPTNTLTHNPTIKHLSHAVLLCFYESVAKDIEDRFEKFPIYPISTAKNLTPREKNFEQHIWKIESFFKIPTLCTPTDRIWNPHPPTAVVVEELARIVLTALALGVWIFFQSLQSSQIAFYLFDLFSCLFFALCLSSGLQTVRFISDFLPACLLYLLLFIWRRRWGAHLALLPFLLHPRGVWCCGYSYWKLSYEKANPVPQQSTRWCKHRSCRVTPRE